MPKTALVTGSTRGIGRGIARALARDGCVVGLNYAHDGGAAEEALGEMRRLQKDAIAIQADVLDPEPCRRLVAQTIERIGPLDILVNNVGPFLERPLLETSDAEWRTMVDGNVGSAFWCARAALAGMRARRGGCIVNVSALSAEISPGMTHEAPAYFVAKSALAMLTRTMARTEGPHGIRVNAVSPGFIETEGYAEWDARERARWLAQIPAGRFGTPDEVGEAVAWLVSDRASYVSGTILHVHGGLWV